MPLTPFLVHAALLARLAAPGPVPPPYPFAAGETLRYEAKLGYLPIGGATAVVRPSARERGREALVFAAAAEGGPPGLSTRYDLTSWVAADRFVSLRFHRRRVQGRRVEEHRYQIVPDSGRYRELSNPRDWVTPPDALDELAFLYYLRTIPLEVGRTYTLARYFQTGYNPIVVRVVGREAVPLPGGESRPCLRVEATARGATVGVWLTDDARRLPAQLTLPLPWGTATLQLVGVTTAPARSANR
jgi:hypothetical protein